MALAADEAGIQFRIFQSKQRTGGSRDAGPGRSRALQGGDSSASSRISRKPLVIPAGGGRPHDDDGRPHHAASVTQSGIHFLCICSRTDGGDVSQWKDPRRDSTTMPVVVPASPPRSTSGGASRSKDAQACREGRLKTGTPPRIDGRSIDFSADRSASPGDPKIRMPVFSFMGTAAMHPEQLTLLDHAYECTQTHDIIRAKPRSFTDVQRRHRRRGSTLLPEHRGQDPSLRGQGFASGVSRAGRPDHERVLSERDIDESAVRCAVRPCSQH